MRNACLTFGFLSEYITGCKINEGFLGFYDIRKAKIESRLTNAILLYTLYQFNDAKSLTMRKLNC